MLKISTALCERNPSNAEYQRGLVGAQARLADLHQAAGRVSDALGMILQSLEISKRLVEDDPTNAGLLRDVGMHLRQAHGHLSRSKARMPMRVSRRATTWTPSSN